MTPRPLSNDERRAAAQLGQGATQQAAADGLGVSVKTVRRLTKREDFAALVEQARSQSTDDGGDQTADGAPDKPTPRSVLEEMLVAVQKNGEPAKALRMQAAVALAKLPDDSLDSDERVIERVYVTADHPDHAQVVGVLDATPANEFVAVVDAEDDFRVLADRDMSDPTAAKIHALTGPSSASTGDEPASPEDMPGQPSADETPRGHSE